MIDDTTAETASLYVLDLLEPAEARAFALRVEAEPELRERVRDLTEAAASLAHSAPPRLLPPGLEAQVLAAVRPGPAVVPSLVPRTAAPTAWLGWALAACFATSSFWLWSQQQTLRTEQSTLRTELVSLRDRDELNQIRIATLASKLASAPDASAIVMWDEQRQRGVLRTKKLPAPPADHDYQLWVIDAGHAKPVDGGVFPTAKEEVSFRPGSPVSSPKAFAISLEQKGGVPEAKGPIVLVGE